jgi:hypothetical protein
MAITMSKATAAMTTVRDEFRCSGVLTFMLASLAPGLPRAGAF